MRLKKLSVSLTRKLGREYHALSGFLLLLLTEAISFVFPKDTIVLDKFLLAEKEQGRRRFTMAHEASHHILSKMYAMPSEGRFHAEYDSERSYSKEELAQMFASVEWQADTMGASLLMPRRNLSSTMVSFGKTKGIIFPS